MVYLSGTLSLHKNKRHTDYIQIQWQLSFKISDLICFSNWHSCYKMSYIKIHLLEQFCNPILKKVSQVVIPILLISRWLQNSSRMWVPLHMIYTFEKSRWLQDFWKMWVKFWQEFWSGEQMKSSIVLVGKITDYGRPMIPFFIEIPNFWVGQTNRADKFWSIWGIFGRTISTHFGTVSVHVFHYSIIISKKS